MLNKSKETQYMYRVNCASMIFFFENILLLHCQNVPYTNLFRINYIGLCFAHAKNTAFLFLTY